MHISIHKTDFHRILSKTQSIADKRSSMPILSNVLLETSENLLIVKATNLEVGIKLLCDVEVKKDGKIALSAKSLFDIVREMPDERIALKTDDNNTAEISCGKAVFNIVGSDYQEFPRMMEYDKTAFSAIPVNVFKHMIEKTLFSISNDETRPFLNGALLERKKDEGRSFVRMVTTDGRRLSYVDRELALPENLNIGKGIIIPQKGLSEIIRNFDSENSSCEIGIEKNFLILKENNIVLYMRLIDGSYPDYKRAIPSELPIKVFIKKDIFLSSLKRVSLVSDEKTRSIRFSISGNKMKVYTDTSSLGDAREDIGIECEGNTDIDIGFNARFIIDILSVINYDRLLFKLKNANTAGIISPIDNSDYLYLVMPLRT